ncbi:Uncharacterized protein HZ326_20648 [Fusarium oxysporum f. sp. albedinis]|nr:Uncharacterized protein HZ326_20648 [Fusarium oxysporum f. sp. albedinis]
MPSLVTRSTAPVPRTCWPSSTTTSRWYGHYLCINFPLINCPHSLPLQSYDLYCMGECFSPCGARSASHLTVEGSGSQTLLMPSDAQSPLFP